MLLRVNTARLIQEKLDSFSVVPYSMSMNINDRFTLTLTAEQFQTCDAILDDQPSQKALDAAKALFAACSYSATALAALAAVLRDDGHDDDASLLLSCSEVMAEYEATVV